MEVYMTTASRHFINIILPSRYLYCCSLLQTVSGPAEYEYRCGGWNESYCKYNLHTFILVLQYFARKQDDVKDDGHPLITQDGKSLIMNLL